LTGLGSEIPDPDAVTSIATTSGTTTTATMVLLAEMLALALTGPLAAAGVSVPATVDGRLAMLVLAAPVMLRWSYLLREPEPERASSSGSICSRRQSVVTFRYAPTRRRPPVRSPRGARREASATKRGRKREGYRGAYYTLPA
jgi:hypothetical protein